MLAVQRHPELYRAFIGTEQMVSPRETDCHEVPGRATLADEWFQLLNAPTKQRIVYDTAGHLSPFERPTCSTRS